jgi:Tol biopolymer transport system component
MEFDPVLFIDSNQLDRTPKYSRDGSKIVFQSTRSGSREIWVCDSDGNDLTELTDIGGSVSGAPDWSPDGKSICFESAPNGNRDIYVISAHPGSQPQRLTTHPETDMLPTWSKNGRWVYFGSTRTGREEIWKVPSQGGKAIPVTHKGGRFAVESPDGRSLYFSNRKDGRMRLLKMSLETGKEELVLQSLAHSRSFSVLEEGIYFKPDDQSLEYFSFETGRTTPIFSGSYGENSLDGFSGIITVSPDGQWLLLFPRWRSTPSESDLMLVENFE